MKTSILTWLSDNSNDKVIQRHYKNNVIKHFKLFRNNDSGVKTYLDIIKLDKEATGKGSIFLLKNSETVLEVTPSDDYIREDGKIDVQSIISDFNSGKDTVGIFLLDAISFDTATNTIDGFKTISPKKCKDAIIALGIIPFMPKSVKEMNMYELALSTNTLTFNDKAKEIFKDFKKHETLDRWLLVKPFL